MIANLRIAAASYALPSQELAIESVLAAEATRIEQTLAPLSPQARSKALDRLGIEHVRVCSPQERPCDLALDAARQACQQAGLDPRSLDLILDFSTFPGGEEQSISPAQRLSAELGAETSLNLALRTGGCAGLHLAIKTAIGWMAQDEHLRTALLVTGDSAPEGCRTMLPFTVQGDAASAVLLSRDAPSGPLLLASEATTLSHLYQVIALSSHQGRTRIDVDALAMENQVAPIFYLNLYRLIMKSLDATGHRLTDIDHFLYTNLSQRDRDGFRRMCSLAEDTFPSTRMAELGHTFASDLAINYVDLQRQKKIAPGQLLLFASAGVGFTWGVTLAQA